MRVTCSICTELYDGTQPVSAVQCGHTFHDACLEEWLHQSLTCPQCRVRVDRRKVIHKLFFTHADDGEGDDTSETASRLQNELETAKLNLHQKNKEKGELVAEQTRLNGKIQELSDNYRSMEHIYKQECTTNKDLKKQLLFYQKHERESDSAKEEAAKLRKKLILLQNVEKIVQGSEAEILEMVSDQGDAKQLATWCSVLRKELSHKRSECRSLRTQVTQCKKEMDMKKVTLQKQTLELTTVQEQSRVWEDGLSAAEKEIVGLKKRLDALQKAVDSPSSGRAGLVHRLLHESPAPCKLKPPKRTQCNHSSDTSIPEIDLNVSGDLFSDSPQAKRKRKSSDEAEVKYLNITADSGRPSTSARQPDTDTPDLPPMITGFNLFKKRSNYGLQEQPSIMKQGYNGLGGHEKFIQFRGKTGNTKTIFKKPAGGKSIFSGSKKPPSLPTLENFVSNS